MTLLVLIIATLNLYLGYAVAVRLGRYARPLSELPVAPEPTTVEPAEEELVVQPEPEPEPQPAPVQNEGIPENWSEILGDAMLTDSFVEAAVHVLRLEVGEYRNSLVDLDQRVRHLLRHPDGDQLAGLVKELRDLNIDWLAKQADAAAHLDANRGNFGGLAHLGDNIEGLLLEQAAQIETTCSNIDMLDLQSDTETVGRRLIEELGRLLDLAHNLRDMMAEMFMAIARSAGKLSELDARGTVDSLTGLLNRTGIETVMENWINEDPSRERAASAAILDIDGLRKISQQIGAEFTDQILGELGPIFDGLTRQNRGYDVTARFAGQRFFVFFGDSGPRGAVNSVERMRQTLAASKLVADGKEFALTTSAGVAEFGSGDTSDTLIKRLLGALREAKKAGRNKTFLDDGNGPEMVTPPNFALPGRTIELIE